MSRSNFSTSSSAANSPAAPIDATTNPARSRDDSVGSSASSLPRRTDIRSHSRSISASSVSGPASIGSRKSRYAEPGTSEVHAELATFSAHPHSPRSVKSPRALIPQSRCHSTASESVLSEDFILGDPAADSGTPRLRACSTEPSYLPSLPEPALTAKSSLSDIQSRRLSGTSIYSLASARGVAPPLLSGPAPTSDPSTRARSASNLMSSGKGPTSTPPEAGVSNVTVTTSSSTQGGQPSAGGHALAPRDHHSQPLDLMRRNQRSDTSSTSTTNPRSQPDRSRSRVKRRFSGSTGNSSHSPGSDRDPSHREKEEGCYP